MNAPHVELFSSLVLAQIEAWNTIDAAAKHVPSMSAARLLALRMLADAPDGMKVTELARQQNITDSAASRFCDRLLKDGLVTRERSAEDKRVQVILITETGTAALHAALARSEEAAANFFATLSPGDQQSLARLLEALQNR